MRSVAPELSTSLVRAVDKSFYPISQAIETIIVAMLLKLRERSRFWLYACSVAAAGQPIQMPVRYFDQKSPEAG